MKVNIVIAVILTAASLFCLAAEHTPHWGYEGQEKPENWGKLAPDFSTCENGKNQSPINIQRVLKTRHSELSLTFESGKQEMINNGHTVQINITGQNTLILDDETFTLQQFHFHSPSENEINSKRYPMEAHFVYQNENGDLTVMALMFKEGKTNLELEKAWHQIPISVDDSILLDRTIDIKVLLPEVLDFYRFSGSLTTPPCTEGVRWIVLEHESSASKEQIEKFHSIMHHDNNRPVQPLNGRIIID
jgi:carbonic anhydrase